MMRYIGTRLLQAVIVIWAAFTVSFLVLYLLPSDPAELIANAGMMSQSGEADPQQIAQLRHEMGLDRPVIVQYATMLGGFLVGDWGQSYQTGRPVFGLIAEAFPNTASIAVLALVLGTVLGCVIAIASAYTRRPRLRNLLDSLPSVGASLPTFLVALVLMDLLAFRLRLVPPLGADGPATLLLPVLTLSVPVASMVGQILGRGLQDAMLQPYAAVATAKGVSRLRLLLVHVFRTAALPSLTMVGLLVGQLLGGAVVTETVFARQGFGRLVNDSVSTQDIPVVLGLVVVSAIIFAVVTLAVDLLYTVIDPRVRGRFATARRRRRPLTAESTMKEGVVS